MMRTTSFIVGALLSLACAGRAFAQPAPQRAPQVAPQPQSAPQVAPQPQPAPQVAPQPQPAAQETPAAPVESAPTVVAVESAPAPEADAFQQEADDELAQEADEELEQEVTLVGAPVGLAGRIAVSANVDLLWRLDTAFDAFSTTKGSTAGGLSASLTLLELTPRWLLDVGLGWRFESSEAQILQAARASFDANTIYADAALRFELLPWLAPRARVAVGVQHLSASLAPDAAGTPLEGDAFSLMTSLGAGIEILGRVAQGLTTRRGEPASIALSVVVEGGIVLGTRSGLTVTPREPSDDEAAADRIPVVGTHIGSLGGVAPYLRIAGAVRF